MTDQPQEPYTRVPNALLDNMHELGNAELRVLLAVIRKTAGFQKPCDVISVSQVADMTGLTRRNAHEALQALVTAGYLGREQASKQMYCYTVKPYPVGIRLDHTPTGNVPPRDTAPYPVGIQSEAKPYPLGDTQKKDSKEKKERGERATRTPPTPNEIRTALADVCQVDMSVGTREQLLQVNQTAGALWRAGEKSGKTAAEVADAIRYVAGWFRKHDWRGKRGETPRPAQIREVWREAMAAKPKPASSTPAEPVRPRRTREEVAAEAKALRERAARGEL